MAEDKNTPEWRAAKRTEVERDLRRLLRDISDEAFSQSLLDPISVGNRSAQLKSLVGQIDYLTTQYRRLA